MMKLKKIPALFLVILLTGNIYVTAQNNLKVSFRYFMFNNKIPYLTVQTKSKIDGKLQSIPGVQMAVYMDETTPQNLIGRLTTDKFGDGLAVIPKELKQKWDASATHTFIAMSSATKEFNESSTEIEITKARILIDTFNDEGARNIRASVFEMKDNNWVGVNEVEAKAGVRRHGSLLSAGKEQSYTTDSTGSFLAEFKQEAIPGDDNGNITIVAKVEDNDKYGNLIVEKIVPWGVKIEKTDDFNQRTLYATRFKTPLWLLAMAYTIIGIVWGVLIYLVVVVVKVMKIGFSTKD